MNAQHGQRTKSTVRRTGAAGAEPFAAPLQPPAGPSHDGHSQFHIYRTQRVNLTSTLSGGGDWHWRLTGSSGAVVADCGGYRNEAQCLAAVDVLRADAAAAGLVKHAGLADFSLSANRK